MTVVFPDPHPVDHLTAVAKRGKAPGELWIPHGVAIDLVTNHIYVAEGDIFPNFARVSIFSESGEYLNSYIYSRTLESIMGYRHTRGQRVCNGLGGTRCVPLENRG